MTIIHTTFIKGSNRLGDLFYEYLFLTPKQRSELPNNAKMEAGAIIGQAANRIFANKIYDRNKKQYFENK